jgi:hypothetical protein
VAGEQIQRLLEDLELGAGGPRRPAERALCYRAEGLGERLVGQLGADQVDRPAEQGREARLAGAAGELGGEPGLADARLAGHHDGRAAARPRGGERPLERPELAGAACERLGARLHAASIAPRRSPAPAARKALISMWPSRDREPGRRR